MSRRLAAWALTLLTALNFLNYLDRYILPAVQVPLENDLHISNLQFGLLFSSFFIAYAIGAIPIGMLADRTSRRGLIAAGGIVWSGATLLTAVAHTYAALFLRHVLVGIGEASFATIAPAYLADLYGTGERGRVLAIFNTSLPVGMAAGTILGGNLAVRYGWRMPFLIGALPGLLVSLLILLLPEPERGAADPVSREPRRRQLLGLWHNGAFLTASLGMAMLTFSESGLQTFVIKFLVVARHVGLAAATDIFGAMSLFNGIVPVILGGMVADRLLRRDRGANYRLSAWSMGLAIPAMALAIYGHPGTLWPAMFATEFILFINTGPLNAAIVDAVAAPIRATAMAVNIFIIHFLGDVPAPVLMGRIADRHGLPAAFALALVATALSAVILAWGARFAPPRPAASRSNA